MPRCPKDSKYKIGLYRTPAKSIAGGERTQPHGRLPALAANAKHFLPVYGAQAELWGTKCHIAEASPQLLPVVGCHIMR